MINENPEQKISFSFFFFFVCKFFQRYQENPETESEIKRCSFKIVYALNVEIVRDSSVVKMLVCLFISLDI